MEEDRLEYVEKLGDPAGSIYYHLLQEMWRLTTGWQVYRSFFGKNQDVYNLLATTLDECFPYFETALYNDTLIRIRRITDVPKSFGRDNICIRRLVEFMDGKDANELQKLVADAEEVSAKIKLRASRTIAHFDERTAFGSFQETGLSRLQITAVIDKIGNAIKFFAAEKINTDVMLNPHGLPSTVDFLVTLFEGTQARERLDAEELERAKQDFSIAGSRRRAYPSWLTEELEVPLR